MSPFHLLGLKLHNCLHFLLLTLFYLPCLIQTVYTYHPNPIHFSGHILKAAINLRGVTPYPYGLLCGCGQMPSLVVPLKIFVTPQPQYTPPSLFILCKISGNISVCPGCRNKYPKKHDLPDDLSIKHKQWCEYNEVAVCDGDQVLPWSQVDLETWQGKPPTTKPNTVQIEMAIYFRILALKKS